MKRSIFSRLMQHGRRLWRGRRRQAVAPTASFLRLETLEDRRLLAAGFGVSSLFGRLAPVSIEITIQQPTTVVASSSGSYSFAVQNSEQSLFSFLGSLNFGAAEGTAIVATFNNSAVSSTGVVSDLPTSGNSTTNNLVSPGSSAVSALTKATQPLVSTATNVASFPLPSVSNLLFASSPISQPALPTTPSVGAVLTTPVNGPTAFRNIAPVSSIANAGSGPAALAIPPEQPPSFEVPAAPVDTVPVVPPALPEPAPSMPVVPTAQLSLPEPFANTLTSAAPIQLPDANRPAAPAETVTPVNQTIGNIIFADLETSAYPGTGESSANSRMPGETIIASNSAADAVFTQVAYNMAQKTTATAKEMLTPSSEHWMRYVAPLFIGAGVYLGVRGAKQKQTNELRPALALAQ